jgi:hypothetical protein
MPIPASPTFTATISAAMISAGRYNVSVAEVAAMQARGAQDVKSELWMASRYDVFLSAETLLLATTGTSVFSLPPDFEAETSLRVYDSTARGRAQDGRPAAIILQASDSTGDNGYVGQYIFTVAGGGPQQYRQITNYVAATKVASVTTVWAIQPNLTTDYLIGQRWSRLDRTEDWRSFARVGIPISYRIVGSQMSVWPPPDKTYPILMVYSPNLMMLDEDGTTFLAWLKTRLALVKQGIKVQTMWLYDDDRYDQQHQLWEQMKARYAAENCVYDQADGSR